MFLHDISLIISQPNQSKVLVLVVLPSLTLTNRIDDGCYGTFLEAGERRTQAAADVLSRRVKCRLDASRRPEGETIYKH